MITIFRDANDSRAIVARLISAGYTIQQVADFLGTDYFSVYDLIHKIEIEIRDGVKLKRGRRRVEQKIFLPPKKGRPLPPEKLAEVRRLLTKTNLTPTEIADRLGLRSRWAIYKIRDELNRRAVRGTGSFQPRSRRRCCPVHGEVTVWPCVACAAIAASKNNMACR
jgi:DNA-binding CsgD family transcriptional regulator